MKFHINNRYLAFAIHVLLSVIVILGLLLVIMEWWYPAPYFKPEGVWYVVAILGVSYFIVGPLLTFIIFKPGKPGLKFDLVVIAILQLIILSYGGYVIYQQRPIFVVFAVDRFTLVSSKDIDLKSIDKSLLNQISWRGPVLVYAHMPEDKAEQQKLVFGALDGKPDLEFTPKYYEPFMPIRSDVLSHSLDVEAYIKSRENSEKVRQIFLKEYKKTSDYAYFPLVGKSKDELAVMNKQNGQIVDAIDIDPWKGFKLITK